MRPVLFCEMVWGNVLLAIVRSRDVRLSIRRNCGSRGFRTRLWCHRLAFGPPLRGRAPHVGGSVHDCCPFAAGYHSVRLFGLARYRAVYCLVDLQVSAPWPHPDRVILEMDAYFEACDPTPPGFINMRGKWPQVRFTLDAIVFALAGMIGICFGPLVPWLSEKYRRRRITVSVGRPGSRRMRPRARALVWLAITATAGWLLLTMEQTRRQWEDEARWARAGAGASYRDGKLIGLHFNVLTLSGRSFGTDHLGDADVSQFNELIDLEDLGLTDCQVTDEGLMQLTRLLALRWLELDGTRITDAGLVGLLRFSKLERLDLSRTQVTDAGLSTLARLPNLRILILADTAINDAGITRLTRLRQLQCLDLSNSQITDTGMEKLRRAMPDCTILR